MNMDVLHVRIIERTRPGGVSHNATYITSTLGPTMTNRPVESIQQSKAAGCHS